MLIGEAGLHDRKLEPATLSTQFSALHTCRKESRQGTSPLFCTKHLWLLVTIPGSQEIGCASWDSQDPSFIASIMDTNAFVTLRLNIPQWTERAVASDAATNQRVP